MNNVIIPVYEIQDISYQTSTIDECMGESS